MKTTCTTIIHLIAIAFLFPACGANENDTSCTDQPQSVVIIKDGANILEAQPQKKGWEPYYYSWSNGVNGLSRIIADNLGTYTVTVTDSRPCTATATYNNNGSLEPKAMTINKIEVLNFPKLNGGQLWDVKEGPHADLRLSINKGTTSDRTEFLTQQIIYEQADPPVTFQDDFPYTINVDSNYYLVLWDEDPLDSYQGMAGLILNARYYGTSANPKYPDTFTVRGCGGVYINCLDCKLYVTWKN